MCHTVSPTAELNLDSYALAFGVNQDTVTCEISYRTRYDHILVEVRRYPRVQLQRVDERQALELIKADFLVATGLAKLHGPKVDWEILASTPTDRRRLTDKGLRDIARFVVRKVCLSCGSPSPRICHYIAPGAPDSIPNPHEHGTGHDCCEDDFHAQSWDRTRADPVCDTGALPLS